jgi:hypothetical protein
MFGQAATTGGLNPNKDVQISPPLADGISSLNFSPRANILVATSWDNNSYCWEVNSQTGQAVPKAQQNSHTAPVLCSSWNADGTGVYTGGCDKTVKLWNLATNQSQQVAAHDQPIRHCAYIPEIQLLVTGGLHNHISAVSSAEGPVDRSTAMSTADADAAYMDEVQQGQHSQGRSCQRCRQERCELHSACGRALFAHSTLSSCYLPS